MAQTQQWYEAQLDGAAGIAVDINAGQKTPGDLYAALKPVHDSAVADSLDRTAESLQEALTQLSGRRTVRGFHSYALDTGWFDHVKSHAVRELD